MTYKGCIIKNRILFIFYWLAIASLFLYSFTQVDLGLTLTRHPFWLSYQRFFQHIGYFNRSLSTYLFVSIVIILFLLYGIVLWQISKNKMNQKEFSLLILVSSVLLVFSYNAFSYDLFNYIFDAKIVTYYNQNPYLHKALDYPGDPMLSFMHWTHRVYPYGPVWLFLTVPLSFLGLQFFLPTFFLFKILMGLSYLTSVYFLFLIAKKLRPGKELFITALFALNPLVIIESLVSAHNDIVMIALFLAGFYYLLDKRMVWGIFFIFLSIGVKFATVFMLPFVFLVYLKKKKVSNNILLFGVISALIPVIGASVRTQFQPWYLLYLMPFAAFIPEFFVVISIFVISACALFEYLPFLFLGNWDPPVPVILQDIRITGICISTILFLFLWLKSIIYIRKLA